MKKTREITEYICPTAIKYADNVSNADLLLKDNGLQVPLNCDKFAMIKGKGSIILDFGKEYSGGIRIITYKATDGQVFFTRARVRFGESLSECCSELGEKNSGNHHSVRDSEVVIPNLSDQRIGSSAFRFVRIDNLENRNWSVVSVYLEYVHCDAERIGAFGCDDARVNGIYEAAVRTTFLNMQNGYIWDGAKRDRLVWSGDLNTEILTARYVFGDVSNVPDSLDFCRECYPLPSWMNNIPAYSVWYILNLCDYLLFSDNREFFERNFEYAFALAEQINACVTEEGKFVPSLTCISVSRPYFLDWPSCGKEPDAENGVTSLINICAKRAEKTFLHYGKDGKVFAEIKRKTDKHEYAPSALKQISAMEIIAGKAHGNENKNAILRCGAHGYSTFMAYYILRALAEEGYTEEAFEGMKEYFGAMLDIGATTFWEDFDLDWLKESGRIDEFPKEGEKDIHGDFGKFCYLGFRHSLCHGWASGAVPFLTEYVMGVRITEFGCRKVTISPRMCGLKYIKGEVPTPYGSIKIELAAENGKVRVLYTSPKEVKVTVTEGKV